MKRAKAALSNMLPSAFPRSRDSWRNVTGPTQAGIRHSPTNAQTPSTGRWGGVYRPTPRHREHPHLGSPDAERAPASRTYEMPGRVDVSRAQFFRPRCANPVSRKPRNERGSPNPEFEGVPDARFVRISAVPGGSSPHLEPISAIQGGSGSLRARVWSRRWGVEPAPRADFSGR